MGTNHPGLFSEILTTLLNDGTCPTTKAQLLTPETVKSMFENQIPEHPNFARGAPPPADPMYANHTSEMYPQEGQQHNSS